MTCNSDDRTTTAAPVAESVLSVALRSFSAGLFNMIEWDVDDEPTRLDWLQAGVAGAAMLVLGATVIFSVYVMRQFKWEMRDWQKPEVLAERELPMGAMHLRLHTLRTDAKETDTLMRVVRTFPPSLRPLPVAMDPASEKLVALLRKEGRPLTVVGPDRMLFRVYHQPPLDEEHRALYGEGLDWSDVHRTVRELEDAVAKAVGKATPLKTILYALPEDGEARSWTWPFRVETGKTFAEAYAAAKSAGDGLTLLALHSDLSAPGCP